MKHLSKVVWSEGMYLGPHHFQAQGRYFEDTVQFGVSSLCFEPYGLIGYQLDAEALRNGTVSLVHARGVFPDGLPFHMPESDPLPAARNIADLFPPTHESLDVMLAISPRVAGAVNCVMSEAESHDSVRLSARTSCCTTTIPAATRSRCGSAARTSACCSIRRRQARFSRCPWRASPAIPPATLSTTSGSSHLVSTSRRANAL